MVSLSTIGDLTLLDEPMDELEVGMPQQSPKDPMKSSPKGEKILSTRRGSLGF
jgi:hypothetical protein